MVGVRALAVKVVRAFVGTGCSGGADVHEKEIRIYYPGAWRIARADGATSWPEM